MSTSKTIVLKSSDGETFEVEEAVAVESQTIKDAIEFTHADTSILLPNVTSKILAKVIEYCKRHVDAPKSDDKYPEDDLKKFDEEFVKVDQGTLFDLILAANYLNIKSLLHLTSQTVTDMIKGKTTEEIRKTFNIKNDFTPEEEERMTGKKRSFARRMTSLLRKKRSFAGIMTSLLRKKRRFAGRMTSLLRRMQHQERGGSHAWRTS